MANTLLSSLQHIRVLCSTTRRGPSQLSLLLLLVHSTSSIWLTWGHMAEAVMEVHSLSNSVFGQAHKIARLSFPPINISRVPHVIMGDEAFPLLRNLMRPCLGRSLPGDHCVYNYRLSCDRRLVECAFGLLASQFWIFQLVTGNEPVTAEWAVKAACILHNYVQ